MAVPRASERYPPKRTIGTEFGNIRSRAEAACE